MNIQRGLTRLSNSEDRLDEKMRNAKLGGVSIKGIIAGTTIKEEDFKKEFEGSHQSIMDTIQDVFKLRSAIQRTNMNTIVNIPELGGDITIADAIIYRQHILPLLETYASILAYNTQQTANVFARAQDQYQTNIENTIKSMNHNGDKPLSQDEINLILKMNESMVPVMYTNNGNLEELRKKITFLKEELDAVLSVNNALTEIENYG